MSINKKIFLLFSSLFTILIFIIYGILKDREINSLNYENQLVENKILNLDNILKRKIKRLDDISYKYSINDKIIEFMKKNNKDEYDFSELSSKLNLSYFVLFNKNKNVLYSEVFDINSDEYLDLPSELKEFFDKNDISEFIKNKETLRFITLDYEKLIFSIEKVQDLGYIFIARTVDSSFLSDISVNLHSYISLLPSYIFKNDQVKESLFFYDIQRSDEEILYANLQVKDYIDNTSFFFSINIKRDFYIEITKSNKTILYFFVCAFVFLNIIIFIFINKIFTNRISLISNTIKTISDNKNLSQNIELIYDDEITYLSKKMNEMFLTINNAQNKKIKKERDFLQSVLDSQQHIIFITDGDNIQSSNQKFIDLFESSNDFMNNIALLDNKTKSNLLKIAKNHCSIDKPAKLKIAGNKDKYFVFDVSKVEIQKYIICMNDVSTYNEKIVQLENKASIDDLTKCFNKRAIIDYTNYWLELKSFCLVILDIDKFKNINDTYGHFIGDCILKDLAKLISTNMAKDDLIGRFGGEEFILLIDDDTKDNITDIANRLRVLIQETSFIYDDLTLNITVSMGCTHCEVKDKFDDLFKIADKALYKAKDEGRNRVIFS